MRRTLIGLVAVAALGLAAGTAAIAQKATRSDAKIDPRRIHAAIAASWTQAPEDWKPRFQQDATMAICSSARGHAPSGEARKILDAARASIRYPPDGQLMGDWKKGEVLAQSGYGLRFTDTDTARPNGGNCYACHQIDPAETSYGTVGPSLVGYGKARKFGDLFAKAAYEKIYNPHASQPCSGMPRFGASGVLTIDQIKDLVALLMDPASPVNK